MPTTTQNAPTTKPPGAGARSHPGLGQLLGSCAVLFLTLMWKELVNNQHELPSFMRDWILVGCFDAFSFQSANFVMYLSCSCGPWQDTASKRLKDPEISRIQDNVHPPALIHPSCLHLPGPDSCTGGKNHHRH